MTADSVAIICASAVPVLGAVGWAARRVWKILRLIEKAALLLFGDEKTPSIDVRLDDLTKRLGRVEKQVTPNGGNTNQLGDRVVRIEGKLNGEPK